MKIVAFVFSLLIFGTAHSQNLPAKILKTFANDPLSSKYIIKTFLQPAYLEADFNGDGVTDVVTTVMEKKSGKKGLLIVLGSKDQCLIFGAGKNLGKENLNYGDDLKWANGWRIHKDKFADETTFDADNNITGTVKRKTPNAGISVWESQDGEPLAGFILFWSGKEWKWLHQGE